jgi:hypothetical protein
MSTEIYDVGYGRPPKANQFQKGHSGNAKGRPKGSRNVSSALVAAFSERITVTIRGQRHSITKLEAAAMQVANQAAGGDRHALKLGTDLLLMAEAVEQARGPDQSMTAAQRDQRDTAILRSIAARARNLTSEAANDSSK